MVARGLEQNDPKLFKVPRYKSSFIILYMRLKNKNLRLPRGPNKSPEV
jgi:hypothetical protein